MEARGDISGLPRALVGTVLITGGSGSLGQAIIGRAVDESWPVDLVVYSRDEVKQSVLRARFPNVTYRLGDIRDHGALGRAMRGVDTVIHAAAYKRVPEAERESIACAQANVEGSIAVIDAALTAGVSRVVGISTDKACHPINAYGQSKALMERLFQSVALAHGTTSFHLVRYGNVLASRGSVIPVLQEQARMGRPITLTDPDMSRFWITLDDAVDLVLATLDAEPGEILVPRCRSASMWTIAQAIAPDAPIQVIGGRGGEKAHESLLNAHEAPFARPFAQGWALRSLALPPLDILPPGFAYTSDTADGLTAAELAATIADMEAGRPTRTLSPDRFPVGVGM